MRPKTSRGLESGRTERLKTFNLSSRSISFSTSRGVREAEVFLNISKHCYC